MQWKLHLKMRKETPQVLVDIYEDIRMSIGEVGALFIFIGLLISTVVVLTLMLELFISLVLKR